jgi:hypothetical protein
MPYCIYKICCDDCPDYIYVGSTKSLIKRKYDHKHSSKVRNQKLYTTIRENGGWDNWRMIVLEECDETIDTKRKAEIKEEEYRVKLNANLNERPSYLSKESKKERDDKYNHRQDVKEKRDLRYKNNKEEFKKKVKCECGCEVSNVYLKRHKLTEKHKKEIEEN